MDQAVADEALEVVDADAEESRARELARRKLSATRGLATEVRLRRLVGMLARRGYSEGLAFRVVKAELAAEDEDLPDWDPAAD
ncbi:hypothetical protein ACOBQX_25070 [Actinokineospora sp. G85]|uniref:hypothetical protein n=1 Tax=Actinokineospora sp. G85 TaxID=3406626 RepID=UPI003C709B75